MQDFLEKCFESILQGNKEQAIELAQKSIELQYDPLKVIDDGFIRGVKKVGELWEEGTYFLPELVLGAEAMKSALSVLQPILLQKNIQRKKSGKVIIGTVQGDIHDIGKTIVATMLSAHGFEVVDLGADVSNHVFVQKAKEQDFDFLCMSSLLTTTMQNQAKVIEELAKEKMRENLKVMVGGAPTSQEWAKQIGADLYAENAVEAVKVANSALSK
ncbi:MAG: corrinoid protein [candidate division Zixibacteria bacterium]|nr:corrinoid protein [candidate division Zixibacteria bacterium]